MPAVSKKHQRFFGMVRKAQKTGEAESPEIAKVAATIKRKDAKDIASTKHKGLPMKKEELTTEAKVDKGRSDYGKASIRNYRRMGPGHGDPGMFDPSGKRGKTIDKRREEHKSRRGVKGAKVPAYKKEEVEQVDEIAMPNRAKRSNPVSYTHLTLPTNREV